MIAKIKDLMYKPDSIRNIGICAHIDHGKTTLSDNLLAGAGMISEELAGDQRFLDFDEQEQARGITIDAANVSMVHNYKDEEYLINLIDTPGHVDFGGDVTRAMRAVDGAVVVVCAVEGIMPQTETVLRQALKENVKPVLFINKVDRLINELKLEPEELQKRFINIYMEANKLIKNMAPEDKKEELIKRTIEILKRDTLSDKTAIAVLEGLEIPEKLRQYSIATKSGMMDIETAEATAKELDIDLIAVTGDQGKVGALAALGLYNDVEEAVKVYDKS